MKSILPKSLSMRILLVFIVAVIPIYSIGVALYISGTEQLVQETLEVKRSQMEYYLDSMESEMGRIAKLSAEVTNSTTIGTINNRYSYLDYYHRGVKVNSLRNDLKAICGSSKYVSTVTAYMLGNNRKLNDYYGFDYMTEADKELAEGLNRELGHNFCFLDDTFYIYTALRDSKQQVAYMVASEIDRNVFVNDLAELCGSIPSELALLYRSANLLLAGESSQLSELCVEADAALGQDDCSQGRIFNMKARNDQYRVACVDAPNLNLRLYCFTTEDDLYLAANRYSPYLVGIIATAFVIVVLLLISIHHMVHKPLRSMLYAFKKVESGDLSVRINHSRQDEFREIYVAFNQMTGELDRYINRSLQQEISLKRSEVLQLQSQINPHFLFNSYFMLHRMIKCRDWESAELLSQYMGEYFRNITRNAKQFVTLREEVSHARTYTEIQKMRFGGRIKVDFSDMPDDVAELPTPKLILQPLIENAFEHGLKDAIIDGMVRVRFEKLSDGCLICVEDNGYGMSDQQLMELQESLLLQDGEVTALRNIHRRLLLIMPETNGIRLSRSDLGGLKVEMQIINRRAENESVDC